MFEAGTFLGWLESNSLLILGIGAFIGYWWVSRNDKAEE